MLQELTTVNVGARNTNCGEKEGDSKGKVHHCAARFDRESVSHLLSIDGCKRLDRDVVRRLAVAVSHPVNSTCLIYHIFAPNGPPLSSSGSVTQICMQI